MAIKGKSDFGQNGYFCYEFKIYMRPKMMIMI